MNVTQYIASDDVRKKAREAADAAYKRWTGRDTCLDGMQVVSDAVIIAIIEAIRRTAPSRREP